MVVFMVVVMVCRFGGDLFVWLFGGLLWSGGALVVVWLLCGLGVSGLVAVWWCSTAGGLEVWWFGCGLGVVLWSCCGLGVVVVCWRGLVFWWVWLVWWWSGMGVVW